MEPNLEELAIRYIKEFMAESGCETYEEAKKAAKQMLSSSIQCFECIDAGLAERPPLH